MKITNKTNLPEAVYKALSHSSYNPGSSDYSVTTLLRPPRMVQLERRHWDKLEEDVLDRVWSLFGSAAHSILEQHGCDESLTEERLYIEVEGRRIGGQIDHYKDGIITDYKVTSAWTLVYGSRRDEWEEQLNIYAEIFRQNGYDVKQLQIVCILRDWNKNKTEQSGDYPQSPIQIISLRLWPSDEAKDFILHRVIEHVEAESKVDNDLPLCTAEDRWEQPAKYAIMKEGRKSAVRVFDTEKEAWSYGDYNNMLTTHNELGQEYQDWSDGYYLEVRRGKCTRCEDFCSVSKFCSQWKEIQNV